MKNKEKIKLNQIFGWWMEAAMLRLFWLIVHPMSLDKASATGSRIMSWFGPRTRKHRHVLANLRMAFPEKSREEVERLGIEMWRNFGAVLAEFEHLDQLIDPFKTDSFVDIVCNFDKADLRKTGRPIIFVAAHCANWELTSFAARKMGYVPDVIYNPQRNPLLEKMVQKKRETLEVEYFGKVNVIRQMRKSLKSGKSIGLISDVRVDGGKMVPFFGVDATTTTMPAWLSLKSQCDIVPVQVERIHGVHFRVTMHPALRVEPANESEEQAIFRVTHEINEIIASWIRAQPGQWLCTKRRWPKDAMKKCGVYSDWSS